MYRRAVRLLLVFLLRLPLLVLHLQLLQLLHQGDAAVDPQVLQQCQFLWEPPVRAVNPACVHVSSPEPLQQIAATCQHALLYAEGLVLVLKLLYVKLKLFGMLLQTLDLVCDDLIPFGLSPTHPNYSRCCTVHADDINRYSAVCVADCQQSWITRSTAVICKWLDVRIMVGAQCTNGVRCFWVPSGSYHTFILGVHKGQLVGGGEKHFVPKFPPPLIER